MDELSAVLCIALLAVMACVVLWYYGSVWIVQLWQWFITWLASMVIESVYIEGIENIGHRRSTPDPHF